MAGGAKSGKALWTKTVAPSNTPDCLFVFHVISIRPRFSLAPPDRFVLLLSLLLLLLLTLRPSCPTGSASSLAPVHHLS